MAGKDFALNCLNPGSYKANPTSACLHLPIATFAAHNIVLFACHSFGWIDDPLLEASLALD